MGIINAIKSFFNKKDQLPIEVTVSVESSYYGENPYGYTNEQVDKRTNICIHCGGELKKVPQKKTKCPHCQKFIYCRTTPDNELVNVSEEGAEQIDRQRAEKTGSQKYEIYDKEYEILKKRFGKEPSKNDVLRSIYNQDRETHFFNQHWGLYRNSTFDMMKLLLGEGKETHALMFACEICYIDMNGPTNGQGYNKNLAEVLPYYTDIIKKIVSKNNISEEKLRETFINVAKNDFYPDLGMTISPSQGFEKLLPLIS